MRCTQDDLLARLGTAQVNTDAISRSPRKRLLDLNDVVDKLARDGVNEGVVVFAESQTKLPWPAAIRN